MKKKDDLFRLGIFVLFLGGFLIFNIWVELELDIMIYKILTVFFLSILLTYLLAQFIYLIILIKPKNKTWKKQKLLMTITITELYNVCYYLGFRLIL